MAFKFPFTNYHELNLTWVLEQLKKLFEESEENVETIESYENRLSVVETELPTVEATADQAAQTANAAATLAQTAKSTADTANENALAASAQAGLARQEAAAAEAEAQAATQAAQQAQATAQNFDGRITQAEADASEALQEAQSFENRVDAAINTANNAANTATIAQGIAVNANQNAATALDTAQTADGKAEAAQDAAEVADGKAEAAQDTADQNAAKIGNLSDLTTTAKNNLVAAINEAAQTGGGTDNTKAPLIVNNASGNAVYFDDGADGMQLKSIVCNIEPYQAGTGTPSPTNERPITPRTRMTVNRTGKNVFETFAQPETIAGVTFTPQDDGTVLVNGTATDNIIYNLTEKDPSSPTLNYCKLEQIGIRADTLYILNGAPSGYGSRCYLQMLVYGSGAEPGDTGNGSAPFTFSESDIVNKWYRLTIRINSGSVLNNVIVKPMIRIATEENSTYELHEKESRNIEFPVAVYQGEEDFTKGKLHSLMASVDLGSLTWRSYSATLHRACANIPGIKNTLAPVPANGYCSKLELISVTAFDGDTTKDYTICVNNVNHIVWVRLLSATSEEDFKTMLSGTQFVYELETPNDYQLDPQTMTTLYGNNTIWTDVGAITVDYPADTKLYIDGKIAELQALILEN